MRSVVESTTSIVHACLFAARSVEYATIGPPAQSSRPTFRLLPRRVGPPKARAAGSRESNSTYIPGSESHKQLSSSTTKTESCIVTSPETSRSAPPPVAGQVSWNDDDSCNRSRTPAETPTTASKTSNTLERLGLGTWGGGGGNIAAITKVSAVRRTSLRRDIGRSLPLQCPTATDRTVPFDGKRRSGFRRLWS
jgi:hypothetical protein